MYNQIDQFQMGSVWNAGSIACSGEQNKGILDAENNRNRRKGNKYGFDRGLGFENEKTHLPYRNQVKV